MTETAKLQKVKSLESELWKDSKNIDNISLEIVNILEGLVVDKFQNPVTLINLGAMYSNLGRHREALKVLREAEDMKVEDSNLFFNLGVVLINLQEADTAKIYFEKSRLLKPGELTFQAYIDFHGY